jgi:hypothetical protein
MNNSLGINLKLTRTIDNIVGRKKIVLLQMGKGMVLEEDLVLFDPSTCGPLRETNPLNTSILQHRPRFESRAGAPACFPSFLPFAILPARAPEAGPPVPVRKTHAAVRKATNNAMRADERRRQPTMTDDSDDFQPSRPALTGIANGTNSTLYSSWYSYSLVCRDVC